MKCKNCSDMSCQYRTTDAEKECFYQKEKEQINQMLFGNNSLTFEQMKELKQMQLQHDWEEVRNKAAIAAMQGIMVFNISSYTKVSKELNMPIEEVIASGAVAYADALVAELRKEG